MFFRFFIVALAGLSLLGAAAPGSGARLKDLCDVQGVRGNDLKGIGLVVGLAGTGDKSKAAVKAQERMLDRLSLDVANMQGLKTNNVAVVVVTAVLPPFAKEGTRIDVQVSSAYDSKSLEGGTLLETYLYGPGNTSDESNVYAVAQGPLSIGGFNADGGGGTSVRKNHVTAGRIPMGAHVEREVPATITDGERITLLLRRPDFTVANNIQLAINSEIEPAAASALGAGTINVKVPEDARADLVSFIAKLEEIRVDTDSSARVVINERTGTLVIGGNVRIKPCQVAHGNLTIEIAATPLVSQPLPFSDTGQTVATQKTELTVKEPPAHLMPVEGTSAGDVAASLNKLKVTPRDMISIFQALREAGALEGDLEIM
ncbi:MAG: flagellar basal body P-ring protein FlgI [Candidatus Hydrogenedentes bacterium]|nr:flagellar basal body P-ring protein FlgI [Candidatus Hydrogenedentota bacterium]